MKNLTLVVKPVGDRCNLRCDYCYNNEECRSEKCATTVMSDNVMAVMTEEFLKISQRRPCLIWHGGEPLLAGMLFFRRALELQRQILPQPSLVLNKVQSNGTLVDGSWTVFAREENLRLGVSLDGPEHVHNSFRRYPNGRGSFDHTFRGATTLLAAGASLGLGAVVHRASLANPQEIFEFFAAHFRRFGFSPYTKTAASAVDGYDNYAITPWEWAQFFKTTFDLWWRRDDPTLEVREFKDTMLAILGKAPTVCSLSGGCNKFLCVEADGSVYPCGRLAGIPELRFGSLMEETLESILESDRARSYYNRVLAAPKACQSCRWLYACHNGCAARRYLGDGQFAEVDPFCGATQEIFTFVAERVGATQAVLAG